MQPDPSLPPTPPVSADTPLEAGEAVGGLLAMEAPDELALGGMELALGDADDYDDDFSMELAMGEADEAGSSVSLTFGVSQTLAGTGAWDVGDMQELVVQETKGDFGGDGSSARDDVMVMEAEYDPDAQIVDAVWQDAEGTMRMQRSIRRANASKPVLLPYGVIAGLLLLLGAGAMVIVLGLVVAALFAPTVVPLPTGPKIPVVEIDEKAVEEAQKKTAEEILNEVLGEDAGE